MVRPRGEPQRQGISVPKILVADDNTNIQKMVSLALEERGISVVSVGNGEAAVRRMPELNPDLVLADIFMPVRNGYEVCEFVKKNERFAHVPVILLVGAFDPLDEKEAHRVGADGVLKKPFVPPDPLIAMVTSALEKNPRVAAELAKAKEEKKTAPLPELPNVDLSARPEPKPLPKFPEPSPEEAELVYGMGKGQRSMESAYAGDAQAAGSGDAPRDQAAEEEEELNAATASDWRRSAMDLEIPAELADQPVIPSDDPEPINFPSEKDYPPRRVSAPEPAAEAQHSTKDEQPSPVNEPSNGASGFSLRHIESSTSDEERESSAFPTESPDAFHLQAAPGPNSTAPGGHWLDAVSASLGQAESSSGGWIDSLKEEPAEEHAEPIESHHVEPEPEAKDDSTPAPVQSASNDASSFAVHEESPSSWYAGSPEATEEESQTEPGNGQSFFADESETEATDAASSDEHAATVFAADSSVAGPAIEPDAADSRPSLAFKDPALVEPPAVHVKPEPLLVDDESAAAPAHSIFAPAQDIPAAAAEFSLQSQSGDAGIPGEDVDERIPTMPPPNREALAHIPFLTPPPSFLAELKSGAPHEEPRAADPQTVDSVVQKVLEKLQPQLQELLSQGLLKPLVENILQNEETKKR